MSGDCLDWSTSWYAVSNWQQHQGICVWRGQMSMASPQTQLPTIFRKPSTVNFWKTPNFHQILTNSYLYPRPLTPLKRSFSCNCICCKTCPIHIPTQLFTSSNNNLTYPITSHADCKSSNLVYQLQCMKYNALFIGKRVRCFRNLWMGTGPWILTSWYHIPSAAFSEMLFHLYHTQTPWTYRCYHIIGWELTVEIYNVIFS